MEQSQRFIVEEEEENEKFISCAKYYMDSSESLEQ